MTFDLGRINISNSLGHHNYTAYCETYTVVASQMECLCHPGASSPAQHLLEGLDLSVVATRAITNPMKVHLLESCTAPSPLHVAAAIPDA